MLSEELKEFSPSQVTLLDNSTCIYCAKELDSMISTKEHVIGRNFIPKGMLDKQWNLIVRACERCNSMKSELENDISAITMQPNAWGDYADEKLKNVSQRKGRSKSNLTGKPVSESQEEMKIKIPFNKDVNFDFTFTSPPQISNERIYNLARLQLMAFFYFITFNHESKKGGFWQEGFYPLLVTQKLNWGNDVHMAFMNAVVNWEPRLLANTAYGFFKSAIRRHPDAECWSWAIEWNKNYRITGFFGSLKATQKVVETFPDLSLETMAQGKNYNISYHKEKTLDESDDLMFAWDEES